MSKFKIFIIILFLIITYLFLINLIFVFHSNINISKISNIINKDNILDNKDNVGFNENFNINKKGIKTFLGQSIDTSYNNKNIKQYLLLNYIPIPIKLNNFSYVYIHLIFIFLLFLLIIYLNFIQISNNFHKKYY